MRDTRLLQGLLLSRSDVDRAAHRRQDDAWLAAARRDPQSRMLFISEGLAAVKRRDDGLSLILMPCDISATDVSFLGEDPQGRAYFGRHVKADERASFSDDCEWVSLRECGELLDDREAGLMVASVALDNWRRSTTRCAGCGGDLIATQAGWAMRCEVDERDHFPRTDPAVIVLPRDRTGRALLGRHVDWPVGRLSTFAGFVEAGESAEAAVRRELREESGIVIADGEGDLVYLGSQPWPFPWSLMLGYHAWTDDTTLDLGVDEIAEAHWFSRDELQAAMAEGSVKLPPPISISRRLIERWLSEPHAN